VDTKITTSVGTLTGRIDAQVQWTNGAGGSIPGALTPTGTATYAFAGTSVNGCTSTLAPTTRKLVPNGGSLYFVEGTPTQYLAMGTAVEGNGLLDYEFKCRTFTVIQQADAKPWLAMKGLAVVPPPGNVLDGTYVPGDGNTYTWHFELQ
jgi:hypothetical protein